MFSTVSNSKGYVLLFYAFTVMLDWFVLCHMRQTCLGLVISSEMFCLLESGRMLMSKQNFLFRDNRNQKKNALCTSEKFEILALTNTQLQSPYLSVFDAE